MRRADPITTEVIRHALETIAEEMGTAVRRTSLSTVVKDMRDYSCALFDASGRLLATAVDIPTLLASMGPALRACIDKWQAQIFPGDVFLTNDPYLGAAHKSDINIFVPVFDREERLIGFVGVITHHADWGGRVPGTCSADNRSVFEEGVTYRAIKLHDRGVANRAVYDIIEANVRHPRQNRGDLRAQLAAAHAGERRLSRLVERYGADLVRDTIDDLISYCAERTRQEISLLPDGTYSADGYLDDDGLRPDHHVRIAVTVTVAGDRMLFDFEGTDAQMDGGMNIPTATTRSAVHYAVKCLLPDDIPFNEGSIEPVEIRASEGTVVNPLFPAAVGDRHLASQRLADVLTRALTDVAPERTSAGWFVGWPVFICECYSPKTGDGVVFLAQVAGGAGATRAHDGADALDVHMANCAIIPAETVESTYPLRVERYELQSDNGGAGRYRGGLGIRADYRNISDQPLSCLAQAEQWTPEFAPPGLDGGLPGSPAVLALVRDGVDDVLLPGKGALVLQPGDSVSLRAGGGGGCGAPGQRDSEAVLADVRSGRVSADAAYRVYGAELPQIGPSST